MPRLDRGIASTASELTRTPQKWAAATHSALGHITTRRSPSLPRLPQKEGAKNPFRHIVHLACEICELHLRSLNKEGANRERHFTCTLATKRLGKRDVSNSAHPIRQKRRRGICNSGKGSSVRSQRSPVPNLLKVDERVPVVQAGRPGRHQVAATIEPLLLHYHQVRDCGSF